MAGLNKKREAFIREYVKHGNATQAAITAGFSEKTAYAAGARLLKNNDVLLRMNQIRGKIEQKTEITVERWLKEVAKIAFFDAKQVYDFANEHGVSMKNWDAVDGALIAGISEKRDKEGNVFVDVQFHPKAKALEMMGRYFGAFNDKLKLDASEVLEVFDRIRERRGSR